jgi:hypothetical protein
MLQRFYEQKNTTLWLVLLIQSLLILWIYFPFFQLGEAVLFCPNHDGLKNYFTYFTYLTQDKAIDADFYTAMNYPFGEYIFYTDNTPTLAVPLKWFSDNILDITPYAFRIFNWFCLSGILLSTLFSWLIINKLTKNIWLFSIFAITLPWITPQIYRLGAGHFNLSFSWVYLVTFFLLIKVYEHRENWKRVFGIGVILGISTYLISFIHLYYLPMLCLIIGMFGLTLAIWERKNWKKAAVWLVFTFGLPMISLLAVFLTVRLNDDFYGLRAKVEKAYNWTEWSLKIDGFYTNYDWSTIPFLFKSKLDFDYEGFAYLGLFVLYGFVFLLIWLILKTIQNRKRFKTIFQTYFADEKGVIALLIFFAGLMCFNMAIGEYAKMFNNKLSFDNPLHPFKYARLIAGEVTQFRVLARFSWVSFWAFNFIMIYLFDQFFDKHKQLWIRIFIGVLAFSSVVDMIDIQRIVRKAKAENVLKIKKVVEPINDLLVGINTKKYQAILPIPFYMIGSEVDSMMLMANNNWRTRTFVLSLQTDLPLIATNLSRSAVIQHEALLSIFTKNGTNDYLKAHLDNRPILVFMTHTKTAWNMKFENQTVTNYFQHGKNIPKQYNMTLLKTIGGWDLYEWYP